MERGEPTFVPEWYKGSTGSSSGNSNHHSHSSWRADERGVRHLSRDRSSASSSDLDSLRSSAFPDGRSSSYRRSLSSNGSSNHSRKSTSNLRPYSSFGRSLRDNDHKKDHDPRERSRSVFVENEFTKYTDSSIGSRNERDSMGRTSSSVGRLAEHLSKGRNSDLSNGVITGTSTDYNKHSFEREFPSLGVEDRQPDVSRVSSPGLTALDNLSRISSMATGGDGWTSALAEAPARVGGNGSTSSSTALGSSSRLNMAEALVQAPPQTQNASQESVDTQKIEEFTRLQYSKLIPIRPSMPKSLVLNSSEKSKVKGARSGEYNAPSKIGLQSSSQHVGLPVRAGSRSDVAKTSQVGNNQVINREKNGVTSIARDGFNLLNISSGEKRSNSQTQNRNDFFKFIRQKAPANRLPDCPELNCISEEMEKESSTSYPGLDSTESDASAAEDVNVACEAAETSSPVEDNDLVSFSDLVTATSFPENGDQSISSIPLDMKLVNDSGDVILSSHPDAACGDAGSFTDPVISGSLPEDFDRVPWDSVPPSEEEAAFLRSLGWNETTCIDALTPEEIAEYIQKYPKQKSSSMLNQ